MIINLVAKLKIFKNILKYFLFRSKEILGCTLASIHNLHFITHMVDGMRETMQSGDFANYKKDFLRKYYKK